MKDSKIVSMFRWLKHWPNVEEAWVLPICIIAGMGIMLIIIQIIGVIAKI